MKNVNSSTMTIKERLEELEEIVIMHQLVVPAVDVEPVEDLQEETNPLLRRKKKPQLNDFINICLYLFSSS